MEIQKKQAKSRYFEKIQICADLWGFVCWEWLLKFWMRPILSCFSSCDRMWSSRQKFFSRRFSFCCTCEVFAPAVHQCREQHVVLNRFAVNDELIPSEWAEKPHRTAIQGGTFQLSNDGRDSPISQARPKTKAGASMGYFVVTYWSNFEWRKPENL